ncbi:GDP-mannose 4,6-dehydratase [Candidatus Pacearchaeota archaeon]|nr:GDP-mannose 4,6-dehydratase [Candidatus Pacearchaeota archaeon]
MSLKNKSVLVTGGAGFIGSHLVDRIIEEEPDTLVVVDDFFIGDMQNLSEAQEKYKDLKVYDQDASEYEKLKKIVVDNNIEVVFDLATLPLPVSLEKPRLVYETNITRSLTLCELIRNDYFKTLIHYSSSEAYGSLECEPMSETHPWNPTTPYAASKAAEDHLVFSYYHTFGIEMAILRPFNNYGPRQNEKKYAGVIPLTIRRIINGEPPIIFGDGNQTRDYIYATDTADATIKMFDNKNTRGKVLNIASGKERTINEIINTIIKYFNFDKPIEYKEERQGDVRRHFADISLAEKLIGFKPTVSFEEGIKLTIEWYKKMLSADKLNI